MRMNFQRANPVKPYDFKGQRFVTEIFPVVLHSLLDAAEETGYSHIVSWQPHGRCFVIRNRAAFIQSIMPSFFRMSKYASFQRQLNLYNFKCITEGTDKGGYYHESFVRGQKSLCKRIVRQPVKGTRTRKPASEAMPDFYRNSSHGARFLIPPNVPLGHRGDTVNESSNLSDEKVNASVLTPTSTMPTTSFAYALEALRGFSKTTSDAEADMVDWQGPTNKSATFSAAATKFERLCDSPGAGHCAATIPYANHEPEVGGVQFKSILPGPSHKTSHEAMRTLASSAVRGTRHPSCVSILRPHTHYSRLEENQRSLNRTESLFSMGDEAFNMTFDNFGFSDWSTSSHQDRSVEGIAVHERFETSDNDTTEGENFLRMPRKDCTDNFE